MQQVQQEPKAQVERVEAQSTALREESTEASMRSMNMTQPS